ncbi:hypothetical protein D1Y85_24955 [Paraburkholderia dinghuensis]|uniref:DUF2892 domain-containing protein n=1 Tax=Paraburkholderia dinghuensis TaxID=2305225 RepID=A0A3N6MHP3_9BURK|nr:hypothetical protein D1Y85_24955 [Paraburkholderia dinghuensis]
MKLIEDGNLSGWVCTAFIVTGIGICYLTFKYLPPSIWSALFALSGLGLAAVGGMCSRARLAHIKPFDNSYKKARKSYETKDDEESKS